MTDAAPVPRDAPDAALRALVASLPDVAYVVGDDGETVLACNGPFATSVRRDDPATCIGERLSSLFRRPESAAFVAENRRVLATGVPLRQREEGVRALGVRRIQVEKHPLTDDAGRRIGVFVQLRDVTGDERAAAETRRMAALLDRATAHAGLASAEVDLATGDVLPSAELVALLGAAPRHAGALARRARRTVHDDDRPLARDLLRAMRAVARGGREDVPHPVTLAHRVAGGATRWITWDCVPLAAADGHRTLLVTGLDVTERRRLEERVAQQQKLEGIGRLAGGVAHDYNNLLTAIIGYVDLLAGTLPAGSPQHADVLEIGAAARRAADLTARLLAVARRQVSVPQPVDVGAALRTMAPLLARLVGDDVTFTLHVADDAWPVLSDDAQLQHVLLTLVGNARDAVRSGGGITVALSNAPLDAPTLAQLVEPHPGCLVPEAGNVTPGDYVRLAVTDDGGGMDDAVLSRLFDPFFTTKPIGEGTGLGLATLFGSVRQGGGFVRVRSRPAAGSTFEVFLPRTTAPATPTTDAARRDATAATGRARRAALTDVVVGAPTAARDALVAARLAAGGQVLVADDVAAALRLLPGSERPLGALHLRADLPSADAALLAATVRRLHPDAVIHRDASRPSAP